MARAHYPIFTTKTLGPQKTIANAQGERKAKSRKKQ